MRTALLLVNMQKECFRSIWAEFYRPEQAARNARLVLDAFRRDKLPADYVQSEHVKQSAAFFIQDIGKIGDCEDDLPETNGHVVVKYAPDTFHQTDLQASLEQEGIESLVVCGMTDHIGINTAAGKARRHGCGATFLYDTRIARALSNGIFGDCSASRFVKSVFFPDLSHFCHVFCWR